MQLQHEWNKIKTARGYGNRWDHWIISFELIPYVPVDIPDFALVGLMCEITQFDCDYHCKNESAQRQQLFQHKIRIDHDHNFGKLTYKLMKAKQGSSLTEVPVQTESHGKLLRSQKGQTRIIIDPDLPLQPGSNISFGDIKALVSSKEHNVLTLQKVEGVLPTQAKVVWHHVAVTPDEIYDEFRRFWSPMWLRDSYQDQFSSDNWQSFMQELDDIPLPHCNVQVSVDDPALWKRAIRKLKNGKAYGACGWRHEELKCLPDQAISDLAKIFSQIIDVGLTCGMMKARTILLAKNALPQSMHHGRPITILRWGLKQQGVGCAGCLVVQTCLATPFLQTDPRFGKNFSTFWGLLWSVVERRLWRFQMSFSTKVIVHPLLGPKNPLQNQFVEKKKVRQNQLVEKSMSVASLQFLSFSSFVTVSALQACSS